MVNYIWIRKRKELMTEKQLKQKVKELFKCDNVQLCKPQNTIFVIIENKKTSSNWYNEKGEPIVFEYLDEQIIGHGESYQEAWKNVKYCKKLSSLTITEAVVEDWRRRLK